MEKSRTNVSYSNIFGAILLVAGCCIGAGMLGLPVLSAMTGFKPSTVMFILSWFYMMCTGLLLLEVNLTFTQEVNIVSMAKAFFGKVGQAVAWSTFLFLFYCLLVAYVAACGALTVDFIQTISGVVMPAWVGSLAFTILLGIVLYFGTHATDEFNRLLMAGLVLTYLLLVILGIPHVNSELLQHSNWMLAPFVLPAMVVSFGFHNLVPSLTNYLQRETKPLCTTILVGSLIPLFIYIVWQYVILGIVPIEGGFQEALDQGQMATHALKAAIGASWITHVAHAFAFFAIVTSFVAVALSFVDFLADGLQIKKTSLGKAVLCSLVLLPPFIFSLIYPHIFLVALNYAGGIGAVILFGILPAAMVWKKRYINRLEGPTLVPGGKLTLALVMLFSGCVVLLQLAQAIGVL